MLTLEKYLLIDEYKLKKIVLTVDVMLDWAPVSAAKTEYCKTPIILEKVLLKAISFVEGWINKIPLNITKLKSMIRFKWFTYVSGFKLLFFAK